MNGSASARVSALCKNWSRVISSMTGNPRVGGAGEKWCNV
jgi:hypothetical protein